MDKINMFIKPIFDKKKKHDLSAWIKLNKLVKKLKKTSPDFDMLTEIYNFLIILQKVYLYNNNENHCLFSATVPKGYNSAFIYDNGTEGFTIKIILRNSDRNINIVTRQKLQSKQEEKTISFNDGEAIINNKYEEESFLFIIACIMDGLIELIKYYYKNKKL